MNQTIYTKRTSLFLMANLGAEVSRMISAKKMNDSARVNGALGRAEAIVSQLSSHADMQQRTEELKLLGEALHDLVKPQPTLNIKPENLQAYFLPFAMKVMAYDFVHPANGCTKICI